MPYIPADAKWYLADIVEEIRVEGARDNVVHINTVLIRADSPEEAYTKALACGNESTMSYENPQGATVHITFRGLRNLSVIYDGLEDGAELIYEEAVGVAEETLQGYLKPKERLNVFCEERERPLDYPNYTSKEIEEEVMKMLETWIDGTDVAGTN